MDAIKTAQLVLMALRCALRSKAKWGALFTHIGKVRRIRSANKLFLRIFVYSLRFAY
jgi:hypothetical protein